MSIKAFLDANPGYRHACDDGPLALFQLPTTSPMGAIYDVRVDKIVKTIPGDFHNSGMVHDDAGNVTIVRTSVKDANQPVATGLKVPVSGGSTPPVEPPADFETRALALLERIATKIGA